MQLHKDNELVLERGISAVIVLSECSVSTRDRFGDFGVCEVVALHLQGDSTPGSERLQELCQAAWMFQESTFFEPCDRTIV